MTTKIAVIVATVVAISSCSGSTQELLAAKKEQSKTSSSQGVDAKDIRGQLQDHQIASLSGQKITGQLSGALIDWRALADDTIHGDSIRSIDGRKITGRIEASLVNWDLKRAQTLNITASSVTSGQFAVERLPDTLPFAMMTFTEEDRIPAKNLPQLTVEKLPPIPAGSIEGTLSSAQLPPLEQLTGKLTAEQAPELSELRGNLPAKKLSGVLPLEAYDRVPAYEVMYQRTPENRRSYYSGTMNVGFDGRLLDGTSDTADIAASGSYYWFRLGKMVTLQFAITSISENRGGLKMVLPIPEIPKPTEAMFKGCRKADGLEFMDYASGTASIWYEGAVMDSTTMPLVLTTTGSPNCPINDGQDGKTFQFFAPKMPANSRITGNITYVSDPRMGDGQNQSKKPSAAAKGR